MIVMVDKSKSFGADPRLFDYVVREVQDSSRVHIVPASKLRWPVTLVAVTQGDPEIVAFESDRCY